MKKLDYKSLIKESVEDLLKLERLQTLSRSRDYVRYIRYLKEDTAKTQGQSGALIGLKERQSQTLWQTYKKQGLAYLLEPPHQGTIGELSYVQISRLQSLLRDSSTALTQEQIADWIRGSFGYSYTQSGISKLFKRLKIKLKTGRPVNVRQKEGDVEAFKKTLVSRSKQ
jgi:transposase